MISFNSGDNSLSYFYWTIRERRDTNMCWYASTKRSRFGLLLKRKCNKRCQLGKCRELSGECRNPREREAEVVAERSIVLADSITGLVGTEGRNKGHVVEPDAGNIVIGTRGGARDSPYGRMGYWPSLWLDDLLPLPSPVLEDPLSSVDLCGYYYERVLPK